MVPTALIKGSEKLVGQAKSYLVASDRLHSEYIVQGLHIISTWDIVRKTISDRDMHGRTQRYPVAQ